MMSYGDPFSPMPNMKGIAIELPFLRFKYVNVKGNTYQQKTSSDNQVTVLPSEDRVKPKAEPIRINYSQPAEVVSFGVDPMVSSASVIHELSYGRIPAYTSEPAKGVEYPVEKKYSRPNLDMIV